MPDPFIASFTLTNGGLLPDSPAWSYLLAMEERQDLIVQCLVVQHTATRTTLAVRRDNGCHLFVVTWTERLRVIISITIDKQIMARVDVSLWILINEFIIYDLWIIKGKLSYNHKIHAFSIHLRCWILRRRRRKLLLLDACHVCWHGIHLVLHCSILSTQRRTLVLQTTKIDFCHSLSMLLAASVVIVVVVVGRHLISNKKVKQLVLFLKKRFIWEWYFTLGVVTCLGMKRK